MAWLLLLSGCTNVVTGLESGASQTRTYIGVVRVKLPERTGSLVALDVQSLGIGWDQGPYLGWKAGNWVIADPAQCQLLIVIRSPAQAENAAKVIQSLGGQNACIADYTRTSRR